MPSGTEPLTTGPLTLITAVPTGPLIPRADCADCAVPTGPLSLPLITVPLSLIMPTGPLITVPLITPTGPLITVHCAAPTRPLVACADCADCAVSTGPLSQSTIMSSPL